MNDRQTQIAEAAIHLFLEEGVGVSTAAVAKAAEVSNGTLFNAFRTKQDLIDQIFLSIKRSFFEATALQEGERLSRSSMQRLWKAHLVWARSAPHHHRVKRLLLEARLASPSAQAEADALAAPHIEWLAAAHCDGVIRGPNVAFIGELVFFHIDLVIDQDLTGADEDLAFDMLCNAIGLKI